MAPLLFNMDTIIGRGANHGRFNLDMSIISSQLDDSCKYKGLCRRRSANADPESLDFANDPSNCSCVALCGDLGNDRCRFSETEQTVDTILRGSQQK